MTPIPKQLSIPELHRRLADTRKVIAREKCVFWLLLGLTLFGAGFLLVSPDILTGILVVFGVALCWNSRKRASQMKDREWTLQKDVLIAENRRGNVETN